MRRIGITVLLALALLASAFVLTSPAADAAQTLRFTSVSKSLAQIDLGKKGSSVGDQIVFSDNVYAGNSTKRRVGHLDGSCTTTRQRKKGSFIQCLVTLTLRNGQITSQGTLRAQRDRGTLAVTGGTGTYRDASGQVRVRFLSNTRARLEVQLT